MVDLPTESDPVRVIEGDCLDALPALPDGCVDAVTTDPPYELGFMGRGWDKTGIAFDVEVWRGVLRVLKPGGYMLAFGGTRTYHRLACAIEDAGFEIRDCLMWLYGTGFPKGQGCLKPAWEPILLARKPGKRVLPLGIDACRVPGQAQPFANGSRRSGGIMGRHVKSERWEPTHDGRWPANVAHDGSDEVLEAFAAFGETSPSRAGSRKRSGERAQDGHGRADGYRMNEGEMVEYGDTGTAARFFYCAKAGKSERGADNTHPTVKPLALMRWLVRLITPPGGLILDPFAGSGTTGVAAALEGRRCILIEKEPTYAAICRERIAKVTSAGLLAEVM